MQRVSSPRHPRGLVAVVFATVVAILAALLTGLGAQSAGATNAYTVFEFRNSLGSVESHYVAAYGYDASDGLWDNFLEAGGLNSSPYSYMTGVVPGEKYIFKVGLNDEDDGAWIEREAGSSALTLGDEAHATVFVAPKIPEVYSVTVPTLYTASGTILGTNGEPDSDVGVTVYALRVETNPMTGLTVDSYVGQTDNEGDGVEGTWSIPGLLPGQYIFRAIAQGYSLPSGQSEISFNAGSELGQSGASITPVTLTGDLDQDVELPPIGVISGTATGLYGGEQLFIDARLRLPDGSLDFNSGGGTEINGAGSYSFNVPPGDYVVSYAIVNDSSAPAGIGQWYSGAWQQKDAQLVTVTAAETTTLPEVTMEGKFPLSGTVTNGAGQPVVGATVTAVGSEYTDWTGQPGAYETTTDSSGEYSFGNLPDGAYYLEFDGTAEGYSDSFYTGAPHGSDDPTDATTTGSVGPADTVNFDFAPVANVTVHLATRTGSTVSGAHVWAVPLVDGQIADASDWIEATAVSGHLGSYLLKHLVAGDNYTLDIDPSSSSTAVYGQWLGGSPDDGDATNAQTFVPALGSSDLDASVQTLSVLTGTVRSTTGSVISGAHVTLYHLTQSEGWSQVDETTTASTGKYEFHNESNGTYALRFTATGYQASFAGGGADPESASHYYVDAGKVATVNESLSRGGSITGFVQASVHPGVGVAGVQVLAYQLEGTPGDFTTADLNPDLVATTNSHGDFSIYGVPTGYYVLSYGEFDSAGDSVAYADALDTSSSYLDAHALHVTAPSTTHSGNATLQPLSSAATASVEAQVSGGPYDLDGAFSLQSLDSGNTFSGEFGADGTVALDVVPGVYVWSTSLLYDAVSGVEYDPQVGIVTVTAGDNELPITTEPSIPLAFTSPPTVTPDTASGIGTTFSVDASTSHGADADVSYQWLRNGTPIFGAQSDTYQARGVDVGAVVSVRIDASWLDQSITQTVDAAGGATIAEGPAPQPISGVSLASATPTVGSVETALPGTWSVPGVSFQYQWLANEVPIVGANSRTFTPTAAQFGDQLSVSIIATAPGYAPSTAEETSTDPVGGAAAPVLHAAPTIKAVTGAGSVTYTVSTGTWLTSDLSFDYQWYADGSMISGATANSYQAPTGTSAITVTVSTVKTGYQPGNATVLARRGTVDPGATTNSISVGSTPVTAAAQPVDDGQVISVVPGAPTYPFAQHLTQSYQWERLTKGVWVAIKGATASHYAVAAADVSAELEVRVTTSSTDYQPVVVTTPAGTGAIAGDDVSGQITMQVPTALVPGLVVTAVASDFPAGVKHSYAWQASSDDSTFTPIADATASTYTVQAADAGDWIRVEVTTVRGVESVVQDAVAEQVQPEPTLSPLSPPTIDGSLDVGQTVTADPGLWNVAGITFSYQWLRNGVPIEGATSNSMILPDDSYGDEFSVAVQASKPWSSTVDVATDAVQVGLGLAPVPTTNPRITGTLKSGSTLSVSTGVWNTAGLQFAFQWYAGATAIPGATNDTYVAESADLNGEPLSVVVTASGPGFQVGTYQTASYGTLG